MDAKLRNILELALDPRTGEGERVAALNAARRLAQRVGVQELLAAPPQAAVKSSSSVHERSTEISITVPAAFVHTMMERVFQEATELGVIVELIKFNTIDGKLLNSSRIQIRAQGSNNQVDKYFELIEGYVNQVRKQAGQPEVDPAPQRGRSSTARNKPQAAPPRKGWFSKLFGG
jgi:hypothetical protein